MIDFHFYGPLRRLSQYSKPTDDSVVYKEYVEDESIADLLIRMGINEEIGDIFINRIISYKESIIPHDESRIAIFSRGMFCIDGAQYLKGNGFITTKAPDLDYPDMNY